MLSNYFSYSSILLIIGIVFLSACSAPRSTSIDRTVSKTSNLRQDIVDFAKQQIGDKYKYGAKGPNRFDCSGLVSYVYKTQDVLIKGSAAHMFRQGKAIETSEAQPGDLIFYRKKGRIFHVSIISEIFNDQFWVIHSTSSRGVIEEDVMSSSYWRPMIYKVISLKSLKE